MPVETIGGQVTLTTAPHPARTDSPEYLATRKWLMATAGGCYVCGGPVDMSHPEAANPAGMEDHHGGGIFRKGRLVGFNKFAKEWSLGFGADPAKVQALVAELNEMYADMGEETYDNPIVTTADVMAWVDSKFNANVKMCAVHHRATPTQHTPDVNGHEAVGVHFCPGPIFAGQIDCEWERFDMWAGTTGTLAVAHHPGDGPGTVRVEHVDPAHPGSLQIGNILPASHPSARVAHAGIPSPVPMSAQDAARVLAPAATVDVMVAAVAAAG